MDIRKIKTLIEMLEESNLKEIEVRQKTSNIDDETEFITFLYNAIGQLTK